jgi:hypothetical protein
MRPVLDRLPKPRFALVVTQKSRWRGSLAFLWRFLRSGLFHPALLIFEQEAGPVAKVVEN